MASNDVLERLAAALAPFMDGDKAYGQKHDTAGAPIEVGYSHGPGGLLTFPGVDNTVFWAGRSATSILGQMPTMPSVYTNPTYFTITGVTDESGAEKEEVCDDAPVAGLLKGCLVTSVFGRYEMATPEMELNRLGQRNDRADPLDLMMVGRPIGNSGIFAVGSNLPAQAILTNEIERKFFELNTAFWRKLTRQLWTGSPANNSAGGGYKELTSFSVLVNTGYADAETNQACPAMDSYLVNFGSAQIDAPTSNIVAVMHDMFYQLRRRAEMTGVMPVRWVMAMRSQMFYELTSIWPCSYLSYRCAVSPGMVNPMMGVIDAQEAIRLRDAMRSGSYLMIDGIRVDVVLDEGIPETETAPGCFTSDVYIIPMSVAGGRAVTYLEYFDFSNPSITSALAMGTNMRVQGAFAITRRETNWCIVWQTKVEPRLVLRTPWLAGRIQNVAYCPTRHEDSGFPDEPYFVNGGKTDRAGAGPSYYSLWNTGG